MGLSIRQVQEGEPASNRAKRIRLSKDKFRFRYFTSDQVSALHRGGEHLNTEEEDSDEELQERQREEQGEQEGQRPGTIQIVDDTNSVLSMNSSMSSSSVPGHAPTLLETLGNLRERLSRVRERRRLLTRGAAQGTTPGSTQGTISGSPSDTTPGTARGLVPSPGRATGQLSRVPSVHSGRPGQSTRSPRLPRILAGARDPEWTEAQRQMAGESILSRPMRHLNASFLVNGHRAPYRASHGDPSSELHRDLWDDHPDGSPEGIERRRQIVQELGASLRAARQRMFENSGLQFYDYNSFLWNLDYDLPACRRDPGCALEEGHRMAGEGGDRFAISRERLRALSRACLERFGRGLPSGVLFEEESDSEAEG